MLKVTQTEEQRLCHLCLGAGLRNAWVGGRHEGDYVTHPLT